MISVQVRGCLGQVGWEWGVHCKATEKLLWLCKEKEGQHLSLDKESGNTLLLLPPSETTASLHIARVSANKFQNKYSRMVKFCDTERLHSTLLHCSYFESSHDNINCRSDTGLELKKKK